ncbi:MAG: Fe-S protein assembly co-chaperone HscB [Burkholderiales bacterium]|nr:Fe-S protein assembly co-chaperone HscB [Burkholderiales bacterium]
MSFDFSRDYFELFELPRSFRLSLPALETTYRSLQSQYHPDRAATQDDTGKRRALQAATQINEAFQTLKAPINRARYLLHLAGFDTMEETNTAMPMDFLMQQMEWREAIAEAKAAKDVGALSALGRDLQAESESLVTMLASLIDDKQDFERASESVRKLRFMEKLQQEVGDAIDVLLD